MSLRTSTKVLYSVCLVFLFGIHTVGVSQAQSAIAPNLIPGKIEDQATQTNVHDEILRTFEREAHAAYSEAKRACETHVAHHDKEICLAKARLQFDADMRYAQQRADQGY